jgi:hypothetical protein
MWRDRGPVRGDIAVLAVETIDNVARDTAIVSVVIAGIALALSGVKLLLVLVDRRKEHPDVHVSAFSYPPSLR